MHHHCYLSPLFLKKIPKDFIKEIHEHSRNGVLMRLYEIHWRFPENFKNGSHTHWNTNTLHISLVMSLKYLFACLPIYQTTFNSSWKKFKTTSVNTKYTKIIKYLIATITNSLQLSSLYECSKTNQLINKIKMN